MMKILKNLISLDYCRQIAISIKTKERPVGDSLVPKSFSAYALPATEQLLLDLTPVISDICQKNLFPTYSYSRMYYNGATMPPHTDRPACEYGLSICIAGETWPLYFEKYGPVLLNHGDAVLYPGLELTHWRDEYQGAGCTQVFLHWVDADGPYAEWQYDRRPAIGSHETKKTYWGKS
jgi:hypothetical protein